MASNAVNGCPSIRVIIQQCLSAKLQVQPPTEDSDAQWVEVRNGINSGGPIIQTLRKDKGLVLSPISHAHQQTPLLNVPQTKRNPLPTKDKNIPPV